jgi:hypothetical protein
MKTLPLARCVQCNAELNTARNMDTDSMPEPGDFTICLYCSHLMVFKDDLTLREPTNMEAVEASTNSDLHEVRAFVNEYRRHRVKKS